MAKKMESVVKNIKKTSIIVLNVFKYLKENEHNEKRKKIKQKPYRDKNM